MSNMPAKSVYTGQLAKNLLTQGVGVAALSAGAGAALSFFASINGFDHFSFLPYFTGAVGLVVGVTQAKKSAYVWHANFVEGLRRVLRMSALTKESLVEQDARTAQADSNDDRVLNAALADAGFPKGIKSLRFFAHQGKGYLLLPNVLRDINGNSYGIQGSQKAMTSRQSAAAVQAARQAAYEQQGAASSARMATLGALAVGAGAAVAAQSMAEGFDAVSGGLDAPPVNVDGTPMIPGTNMDMNGNIFGAVDMDIGSASELSTLDSNPFD